MKKLFTILIMLAAMNANGQTGWFQQNSGTNLNFETVCFVNDQTGFAGGGFKIYKTTDGGTTWMERILPDTTNITSIRFLNSTTGYISSGITINVNWSRQLLYRTTNTGNNWTKIYESSGTLTSESFNDVFPVDTLIYLTKGGWSDFGGTVGSMFFSQNSGTNFATINITTSEILQKISFINSQTGWVSTSYGNDVGQSKRRIFKTTNRGINWTNQYLDSSTSSPLSSPNFGIQFINQNTGFGLYRNYQGTTKFLKTTNSGTTWVSAAIPYSKNNTIFFSDANTGWIGGNWNSDSIMIIRTTNSGNNWHTQKKGVSSITSIYFVNNLTGWAVGYNGVILKTVTGGVTGVQNISSEVPSAYSLSQNYPNPFNPVTKIRFSIVSSPHVSGGDLVLLKVYDITGREVQTLVNERLQAGTYEVTFNIESATEHRRTFGTGVYFYKLVTEGFTETKKMLLLK